MPGLRPTRGRPVADLPDLPDPAQSGLPELQSAGRARLVTVRLVRQGLQRRDLMPVTAGATPAPYPVAAAVSAGVGVSATTASSVPAPVSIEPDGAPRDEPAIGPDVGYDEPPGSLRPAARALTGPGEVGPGETPHHPAPARSARPATSRSTGVTRRGSTSSAGCPACSASRRSSSSCWPSRRTWPGAILLGAGTFLLAVGLGGAAGSQAIERQAAARLAYRGPSPFLLFGATLALTLFLEPSPAALAALVFRPLALEALVGLLILNISAAVLIALFVVGSGALCWREMGVPLPGPTGWRLTRLIQDLVDRDGPGDPRSCSRRGFSGRS